MTGAATSSVSPSVYFNRWADGLAYTQGDYARPTMTAASRCTGDPTT
jgi:hypothetical protein